MAKFRSESISFCGAEKINLQPSAPPCAFFDRKIVRGKALIAMFSTHGR
jgi:hypothetical protein